MVCCFDLLVAGTIPDSKDGMEVLRLLLRIATIIIATAGLSELPARDTMRFPLIGKNRSIFIGNLGLFWVHFYRLTTNA